MNLKLLLLFVFCLLVMVSCQFATKANPILGSTSTKYMVTESLTPTHTFTSTATVTLDMTATLNAQNNSQELTKEAGFSNPCLESTHPNISTSGKWAVFHCGELSTQRFIFINKDGKKWTINYSDYFSDDEIDEYGPETGEIGYFNWAEDDSDLYFETYMGFDGGGTCFDGPDTRGLYRLNLLDGSITPILSTDILKSNFYFSFSSDKTKIAYSTDKLMIRDLSTGLETYVSKVTSTNTHISHVIWSPDGTQFAYTTCDLNEDTYGTKKSTLELYSLGLNTIQTLMEIEGKEVKIGENEDANILNIYIARSNYSFNWLTGSLQETPSP